MTYGLPATCIDIIINTTALTYTAAAYDIICPYTGLLLGRKTTGHVCMATKEQNLCWLGNSTCRIVTEMISLSLDHLFALQFQLS